MKQGFLLVMLYITVATNATAQKADGNIIPGAKKIRPDLFGLFFEDINYSADGGLYAELVQNRSFEYSPTDHADCDLTVLSGSADAENTFENPGNIVPVKSAFKVSSGFEYGTPAMSLTVLRIRTKK